MIKINDEYSTDIRVDFPTVGIWHAEIHLDSTAELVNVTIDCGITLRGTVVQDRTDNSGRVLDVVGGAGGWRGTIAPTSYANDAGVRTDIIARDAARAAGETIGRLEPGVTRIGSQYVRDSRSAWATLLDAAGGAPAYVERDGTTTIGERQGRTVDVDVQGYDPTQELVVVDDLSVQIGDTLRSPVLPTDKLVNRVTLRCGANTSAQLECYCTEFYDVSTQLEAVVERVLARQINYLCEYRVVGQQGDRYDLQPVSAGLPSLTRVELWASVTGLQQSVTEGARALVVFIGGSRARPAIVSFGPQADASFAPSKIKINAEVQVAGSLSADGEVTAHAATPLTKTTLTRHVHPVSGANTLVPKPGT